LKFSRDQEKEMQRREISEALQKYLDQGGVITQADESEYNRERGTLSREQVVKTFAYQSAAGKIKKEGRDDR
jgi:hypothetical protein